MQKATSKSARLRSIVATVRMYTVCVTTLALFLPLWLVLALLPASVRYDNRCYFFLTSRWCSLMLWLGGVAPVIEGKEHLSKYPGMPAVLVANHTSALDIPLLEIVAGAYPHIWMSKKEYGSIPGLGFLLKRLHVLVDRFDPRAAARALARVCSLVNGNSRHIILFPEGTRSLSGRPGEFHAGAVVIARNLARPLVPVFIRNAQEHMPPGSRVFSGSSSQVRVTIGMPIMCRDDESSEQCTLRLRDWFVQMSAHR